MVAMATSIPPLVIHKRAGSRIVVHDNQVFLPAKVWVGALRIKLTSRSAEGERTIYIAGKRVKTIQDQISKKLGERVTYALVQVLLLDRGNNLIMEKSLNLVSSKQSLESFLNADWIKVFLNYNVGIKRSVTTAPARKNNFQN